MTIKIEFIKNSQGTKNSIKQYSSDWFDTSYQGASNATGHLRFPAVSNGNYKSKHPIYDSNNSLLGFLINGATNLTYTYGCIYLNNLNYFLVSHIQYRRDVGQLSIIESTGKFLFRKGIKYERTQSFEVPENLISVGEKAFKLINDRYLLLMSGCGFCYFDTHSRRILSQSTFGALNYNVSAFDLSPNGKLLAVAFRVIKNNPLNDDYVYENQVSIYDLETGTMLGDKKMDLGEMSIVKLCFCNNGLQLIINSQDSSTCYDLIAK